MGAGLWPLPVLTSTFFSHCVTVLYLKQLLMQMQVRFIKKKIKVKFLKPIYGSPPGAVL